MIAAPMNPRADRVASLPFDARLVRPLRLGDLRILGRLMLYLVPVVGALIVLAVFIAKHTGVLADPRASVSSSDPWVATFVLAAALWGGVAFAASIIQGSR